MRHVTHLFKLEYGVPGKAAAFGNNVGCYIDSRLRTEIGSQAAWHRQRSLHSRHLPCWSIAEQDLSLVQRYCSAADLWPVIIMNFTWGKSVKHIHCFLTLLRWTGSLGFEYFWDTVRGLTGTPPTPLNVAVLCHLTAVLIFLPYTNWEARWKQKGRQEYFNIALRSHTICPFHEQADGRVGNKSLHYKQTPSYFRVTCKSRHLTGTSQCDGTRCCEFASFWNAPNDCTASFMCKALQAVPVFDSPFDRYSTIKLSLVWHFLLEEIAFYRHSLFPFHNLYLWKGKEKVWVFMHDCHKNQISHMTCQIYPNI